MNYKDKTFQVSSYSQQMEMTQPQKIHYSIQTAWTLNSTVVTAYVFLCIRYFCTQPKDCIYGFNVLQNKQCKYHYNEIVSATERQAGAVVILWSVLCYFRLLKCGNIRQWETSTCFQMLINRYCAHWMCRRDFYLTVPFMQL